MVSSSSSGSPGTGKTTLARQLAQSLRLPLLSRDTIKEALFEVIGAPDRASSHALGPASYSVLFAVVREMLASSGGAILESNFVRGKSERELAPLTAGCPAALIHCHATRDVIVKRILTRERRHPQHFDRIALPEVLQVLDPGDHELADLAIPRLVVDTTDGYSPRLDVITTFCRRAIP